MKTIGIIGGMGPAAGVDLARKVIGQTRAATDQEHIPFILASFPGRIADRTGFLVEHNGENPGIGIAGVVKDLEAAGARVMGMACNTAHASSIISVLRKDMAERKSQCTFVHMIDAVCAHIRSVHPGLTRIAVLSTSGTYHARVYPEVLEPAGLTVVNPAPEDQEDLVNRSIFHPEYGIKAGSVQISSRVRENLDRVLDDLKTRGAEAVVLGCTEFSLVFTGPEAAGLPVIDSNRVLARALIREAAPDKLLPE